MKNRSKIIQISLILGLSLLAACAQEYNSNPSESGPRDFSSGDSFSAHKIENPVFFTGTKEIQMEQRRIPKEAEASRPDLIQAPIPVTFKNLILQIDLDQKNMNLKFTAVHAKGEENLELEGPFDSSQSEWYAFLYSTDPAVLKETRVRATAGCTDINVCDEIALDLTYEFEGQEYTRQFVNKLSQAIKKPKAQTSKLQPRPPKKKSHPRFAQVSGAKSTQRQTQPAVPQPISPTQAEQEAEPEEEEEVEEETPAEEIEEVVPPAPVEKLPSVPAQPKSITQSQEPKKTEKKKVIEDKSPKPRPATPPQNQKKIQPPVKTQAKVQINDGADYSGPVQLPKAPKEEMTKEEQILTLKEILNQNTRQSIGKHVKGELKNASFLPVDGQGYYVRTNIKTIREDLRPTWGAELLIQLIKEASTEYSKIYPEGPKVQIASLSQKDGGHLRGHASHQHGLDVDIGFLSTKGEQSNFWSAVGSRKSEFDLEKNWTLIKLLNNTKERYIISIFLDRRIKKELCLYAYKKGEYNSDPDSVEFRALRSIHHQAGHHDHYHVRLHCPATAVGCQESRVILTKGTGCEPYIK